MTKTFKNRHSLGFRILVMGDYLIFGIWCLEFQEVSEIPSKQIPSGIIPRPVSLGSDIYLEVITQTPCQFSGAVASSSSHFL